MITAGWQSGSPLVGWWAPMEIGSRQAAGGVDEERGRDEGNGAPAREWPRPNHGNFDRPWPAEPALIVISAEIRRKVSAPALKTTNNGAKPQLAGRAVKARKVVYELVLGCSQGQGLMPLPTTYFGSLGLINPWGSCLLAQQVKTRFIRRYDYHRPSTPRAPRKQVSLNQTWARTNWQPPVADRPSQRHIARSGRPPAARGHPLPGNDPAHGYSGTARRPGSNSPGFQTWPRPRAG